MLTIDSFFVEVWLRARPEAHPESLEREVHIGPGPKLVLDVAQWMKETQMSQRPPSDSQDSFLP